MPAEAVVPRPASTILLLRDSARQEIEVFMMVRHYEIDFNSGALVFPGGSVDKGDQEIIDKPELYSRRRGARRGGLELPDRRDPRNLRGKRHPAGARRSGSKTLIDAKRAGEIEAVHRTALCEGKTTFPEGSHRQRNPVGARSNWCPMRTG